MLWRVKPGHGKSYKVSFLRATAGKEENDPLAASRGVLVGGCAIGLALQKLDRGRGGKADQQDLGNGQGELHIGGGGGSSLLKQETRDGDLNLEDCLR